MTAGVRYLLAALLVVLLAYFIGIGLFGSKDDSPRVPSPGSQMPTIQLEPSAGIPAKQVASKPLASKPVASKPVPAPLRPDQGVIPPVRGSTTSVLAPALAEPVRQLEAETEVVMEEATAAETPAATSEATPRATQVADTKAAADQEARKSPSPPPPTAAIAAKPEPQASQRVRKLPEQIALRYSVQSGEDGITVGETRYNGQIRNGRYELVSVTGATGITALFLKGSIVQRSEGRVMPDGLRPEVFTSVKGEKKVKTVRFDWSRGQLLLPDGVTHLPSDAQDLTSFPFHLAMRVAADDPGWTLSVTNGKNLREYRFQVIGRETLTLANQRVEALHLQGNRSGDARFDLWLAPARDWLPVRIRTQDENGKLITMTLL